MAQQDAESLLWGRRARPSRGRKPGLSVDRIVAEAIALADADGLEGVSMKRIADRLDSGVMSLYRYIPAKKDLLTVMFDTAIGDPPDIGDPSDWRPAVRNWAVALRDFILEHPWAQTVVAMPRMVGPNETAWLEAELRALSGLDIPPSLQMGVALTVSSYVLGATKPALSEADEGEPMFGTEDQSDRFPILMSVLSSLEAEPEFDPMFDFGLERVLDGIEAGRFNRP